MCVWHCLTLVCSLEGLTEADVRAAFQQYGGILRIKMLPQIRSAFIDFADREAAEAAYVGCGGTVAMGAMYSDGGGGDQGCVLLFFHFFFSRSKQIVQVSWSKGKKQSSSNRPFDGTAGAMTHLPPPPPGVAPPPGVGGGPGHIPAGAMYYPSASGASEGSAPVKWNKE